MEDTCVDLLFFNFNLTLALLLTSKLVQQMVELISHMEKIGYDLSKNLRVDPLMFKINFSSLSIFLTMPLPSSVINHP